ncbi:MAG TPA: hypothetical protein VGL22_04335 [Terracidiphilus sp.]|jgi:hypothetical protein
MRKSREIHLTLLASLAVTLTACTPEPKDCVDAQSRKLPDSACQASSRYGGAHYIYGGSSGGHSGDYVIGGSSSSHSILRGGFGAHGEAGGE